MRKGKGFLFRACCSKGVSHHHLHFGRGSKARGGVGKFYSRKKKGRLQVCSDLEAVGGGGAGGGSGAGDGLTRREGEHACARMHMCVLCDWLWDHIWFSLVGPK